MVVTGPTVIMPLLRQAKLNRRSASYLKWEGIVNDPIGALLAVLVFQFFVFAGEGSGVSQVAAGLAFQRFADLADRIGNIRVAVVTPGDALYGVAREWVVWLSSGHANVRVFRTMDEATKWLGLAE